MRVCLLKNITNFSLTLIYAAPYESAFNATFPLRYPTGSIKSQKGIGRNHIPSKIDTPNELSQSGDDRKGYCDECPSRESFSLLGMGNEYEDIATSRCPKLRRTTLSADPPLPGVVSNTLFFDSDGVSMLILLSRVMCTPNPWSEYT